MQLLIVLRGSLPDHCEFEALTTWLPLTRNGRPASDIKVLLNVICSSNTRDPSLFDALTADTQERAELYLILLQILATRKNLETCAMMPVVLSSMSMWLMQEGSPVLTGRKDSVTLPLSFTSSSSLFDDRRHRDRFQNIRPTQGSNSSPLTSRQQDTLSAQQPDHRYAALRFSSDLGPKASYAQVRD